MNSEHITTADERVQEIADLTDSNPTDVLAYAEALADEWGDSVSDELDEGVEETEIASVFDPESLQDEHDAIAENARTASLLDATAGL